jgi:hypothetical protein
MVPFFGSRDEFNTQKGVSSAIRASFWLLICTKILSMLGNLFVWKSPWSTGLIIGENWCNCALCVVIMKYVLLVRIT